MTVWDFASVLTKFINLAAMASIIGGALCLFLGSPSCKHVWRRLLVYIFMGALAGLITSGMYFLIQIGAINKSGLGGMFDRQMGLILAQSGLGSSSSLRMGGFVLPLILSGILLFQTKHSMSVRQLNLFAVMVFIVSTGLLSASFSLIGHVANLSVIAGISIDLHVVAMSLWIGSLYPLWFLCVNKKTSQLKILMHRFGQVAVFIVAVLVLSGTYLLTQLLESFAELFNTSYGQLLLFKLLAVTGLLTLAAINKFKLVPHLEKGNAVALLRRSISMEMVLAVLILIVTAFFTTLIGPTHG